MRKEKEEEEKWTYVVNISCGWLVVFVVFLLLALGYFAIYRDGSVGSTSRGGRMSRGGKWSARGGCACSAPPI